MGPLSVPDQIPETRTQKKNLGIALRLISHTPNSYTHLYKLRQRQAQGQHCWQPPGLAKHDMQWNIYLICTKPYIHKPYRGRGGERGGGGRGSKTRPGDDRGDGSGKNSAQAHQRPNDAQLRWSLRWKFVKVKRVKVENGKRLI